MKAPVDATHETVRNAQLIKAKVIWSTKPMAVVPVLAVSQQGEQSFVFVVEEQQWNDHGAPHSGNAGPDRRQQLLHCIRAKRGRPRNRLGNAIPGGRNAGDPAARCAAIRASANRRERSSELTRRTAEPAAKTRAAAAKSRATRRSAVSHHHRRRHRRALARKSRHTQPRGQVS